MGVHPPIWICFVRIARAPLCVSRVAVRKGIGPVAQCLCPSGLKTKVEIRLRRSKQLCVARRFASRPAWQPLAETSRQRAIRAFGAMIDLAVAGRIVMNACRNLIVVLGCLAGIGHAGAHTEPVIVVPGRPGVPVMVEGQDVSGAVIEGDWGLGRPHAGITIIRPRSLADPRYIGCGLSLRAPCRPLSGGFFPGTGRKPRLGRVEVTPPADRPRPPRAESFQRSWWSESPNLPADLEQPRYPLPLMGVDVDWPSRRHGPRQAPDR